MDTNKTDPPSGPGIKPIYKNYLEEFSREGRKTLKTEPEEAWVNDTYFGWGEGEMTVHASQALIVTQEQLEQIRQLRAVPEPEQLQEGKNNEL
jgi:hypothetical protein